MSEESIAVVRGLFEAFNRGDVDAVLAAFDEDCRLYEPPEMPDTPTEGYRGHDGIRAWMSNLRETGGIEFEPTEFTTNGEVILADLIGSGRGQASGAPIEWRTAVVTEMRDGRVLRLRAFLDRAAALDAAGVEQ
jgi:ketosteroid isomerase-like protein